MLVYGPARAASEVAAEDSTDDALVEAVTAQIRADLSELLVEGATWPERVLVARVAQMLAHDAGDTTLGGWNTIGRQVEAARQALRDVDEASVAAIAAATDRYYAMLSAEGLVDEQVAGGAGLPPAAIPARIVTLAAALPFAALAVVLYWLPYQVPSVVSRLVANDPDEVSTYKLGAGLLVYPIWVLGLAAVAFWFLPAPIAAACTLAILVAPFAALAFRDLSRPLRRSLRAATRARRLDELRAARADVMRLVGETRERLGV